MKVCLWDWNGTLLDDARYAMLVRNRCFPALGLTKLDTVAQYREQFTFPVREYYRRAGVTDDRFVEVANVWMDEYVRGCESLPLRRGADETVRALSAAGIPQVILSASCADTLREQVDRFPIAPLFSELLGLSHIYATSKEAIGREYLQRIGADAGECLMIGDSEHDAEVARALGASCILLSGGHQPRERLLKTGFPVARDHRQVKSMALAFFSAKG